MIYSDLYIKNRFKIPTVVGLLLLLMVVVFFARLFTNLSTPSRATKKIVRRLEITNLAPSQATIFWQTYDKETGWVIFGEKNNLLDKVSFDERDLPTKKLSYLNHYVQLRNLNAGQKYYFKLVNNNQLVTNADSAGIYTFTTPKNVLNPKNIAPAYGKLVGPNNLPIENAVVLASLENSYPISTLTKATGEWLIPLNSIFEKGNLMIKIPAPSDQLKIEIISENNQTSNILVNLSKVSPLPQTIIIGRNFNFINETNVLSASSVETGEVRKEIDIIYPQENALIPGYTPLIKGMAVPNTDVLIDVKSDKIFSSRVRVDQDGVWRLVLPERLTLGEHIITLIAKDRQGRDVTIRRKFVIVATEGNDARVLGVASGEPTVTYAPMATSIPTPTNNVASPSAPVSGSNFNIHIAGGASLIILGLGLILVF